VGFFGDTGFPKGVHIFLPLAGHEISSSHDRGPSLLFRRRLQLWDYPSPHLTQVVAQVQRLLSVLLHRGLMTFHAQRGFVFNDDAHASRGFDAIVTVPAARVAVAMEGAPLVEVLSFPAKYAQDVDVTPPEDISGVIVVIGSEHDPKFCPIGSGIDVATMEGEVNVPNVARWSGQVRVVENVTE
jgi:hypothetical protein